MVKNIGFIMPGIRKYLIVKVHEVREGEVEEKEDKW
jgi:hypothetical protein